VGKSTRHQPRPARTRLSKDFEKAPTVGQSQWFDYAVGVKTEIGFRPASAGDFDYCKRLYFGGMETIIDVLGLDRTVLAVSFAQQWEWSQVRILVEEGEEVGWMQSFERGEDELFLAQLFVDGPFQGRGIGTEVMGRLIAEAEANGQAVGLDVVKINPALRLYERLGFRITGEEEHKFNMRRDAEIRI
jgi:ribosomal protein S18 acetylase RimI-like enzyme